MTDGTTRFAFWGRCSTGDRQDPEVSRAWRYSRADQLVAPRGGVIAVEYIDVDKSRSIPPARRPQASLLLAELAKPGRDFDAVVVGEPQRAFYGNQFSNTFPLFEHYQVPLWVPEVGEPIDPANEAHDMIMSTFGSFSKGQRNRIKPASAPPWPPSPRPDKWIFSEKIVHPPITDDETFRRAQELLTARRGVRSGHKPHKSSTTTCCAACCSAASANAGCKATGPTPPRPRCRFPSEYALATRVPHPLNVTLRQDAVLDPLDAWLGQKFAPRQCPPPSRNSPQQPPSNRHATALTRSRPRSPKCDRKLAQYRAALDAGGDPVVVARWITETEAERVKYRAIKLSAAPRTTTSREEIEGIVNTLSDLLVVVRGTDPAEKAKIYAQLGLRLTYRPSERTVRTEVHITTGQN